MENGKLIPHLFRTEYRKIVSVLCKHFGLQQIEIAEDIAGDTFLTAAEVWGTKGTPKNPTAWLHTVAKNKTINYLNRKSNFQNNIASELSYTSPDFREVVIDFSPQNINDSQLQMMFVICHPSIPTKAQIGLSLRILCGFGIEEIADAFLAKKETIKKRLYRAKKTLREQQVNIELPDSSEIDERLEAVLLTIYLLFNEGYYSFSQDPTLRKDLCLEAMRLCNMLVENKPTNRPQVNALLSLMCFHASRFEARIDNNGELILYEDQDRDLWNADLIRKGEYFLDCARNGDTISTYHLEAGIAWWHTRKADTKKKWENIFQLYNRLLQMEYSPVAALNRTYALAKARGTQEAILEAEKLHLEDNHFYFTLLGELYTEVDKDKAKQHFQRALSLTKTDPQRHAIQKKINSLNSKDAEIQTTTARNCYES